VRLGKELRIGNQGEFKPHEEDIWNCEEFSEKEERKQGRDCT
jgi:hypothetical protein